MRSQITFVIAGIVVAAAGILMVSYDGRPEVPEVGPEGIIEGEYAIGGIMRLGKPYRCEFEREDETTTVQGVVHTDGDKIYGEFRIYTDVTEVGVFNSSLIVTDDRAYTWTSLDPVGFISDVAQSAVRGASPQEQAQIIGLRDKFEYRCRPWQDTDSTFFNPPESVNFIDLR